MKRTAFIVGLTLLGLIANSSCAEAGRWGRYRSYDQGYNGLSHGKQWGDGGLYGGRPQAHVIYQTGPQGGSLIRVDGAAVPSVSNSTVAQQYYYPIYR